MSREGLPLSLSSRRSADICEKRGEKKEAMLYPGRERGGPYWKEKEELKKTDSKGKGPPGNISHKSFGAGHKSGNDKKAPVPRTPANLEPPRDNH